MGDDVEDTKFLPFKEETAKKTEKGKYKMKSKIRAALASSVLLAWLSWLTITSEVARSRNAQERDVQTNKESIMEKIINTKLAKLDKALDTIMASTKENKNTTSNRQRRQSIRELRRGFVESALEKLYNVQHDLIVTREALFCISQRTMVEVKQMITFITKIGPTSTEVGHEVKTMMKELYSLLEMSVEALKAALKDYTVMIRKLNLIRADLDYVSHKFIRLANQAKANAENIQDEIWRWRNYVYYVSDELEDVVSGEVSFLEYLEFSGKRAVIEMLCGLSNACKNYMKHKNDGYTGISQTPIPAQHTQCPDYQ